MNKKGNKTAGIAGMKLWGVWVGHSINLEYKIPFESRQFYMSF